jgi:ABC-type nitrate/sulfonate/bicarbonate transport system substrate-binding protein
MELTSSLLSKKAITRIQSILIVVVVVVAAVAIGAWSMTPSPAPTQTATQTATQSSTIATRTEVTLPPATIKIALNGPTGPLYVEWYYAEQAGIWKKLNLQVELTQFSGGSGAVAQAMAAGEFQMGVIVMTTLGLSIQKGLAARAVASIGGGEWSVVVAANSSLMSVDELKGKDVGISRAGSASNMWFNELAMAKGWTAGTDIKPQFLGTLDTMVAGVLAGKVPAILLQAGETARLLDKGQIRVLANSTDLGVFYPEEMLVASNDLIQSNPQLIQRVVNGLCQANSELNKNPQAITDYLLANEGFSTVGAHYFEKIHLLNSDGHFTEKDYAQLPGWMISAGLATELPPINTWYTTQFVPAPKPLTG